MKRFYKQHKLFIWQVIVCVILIALIIVFSLLKTNQEICDKWNQSFGQFHQTVFGYLNSSLPFSLTELIMLGVIAGSITLLVLAIINFTKKNVWAGVGKLLTISITILSIITAFDATFEMAYNRSPIDLPLYEKDVPQEKYYEIVDYFVDDLNSCIAQLEFQENGDVKNPYTYKELNKLLKEEYDKLNADYLFSYTPVVKPMATSSIYSSFGITGWYFAPTGEAVVNYQATDAEKGMCFAHEMAHAKGVATEEGAQMVASLVCLQSENPYLRYSGYINVFPSILAMANYSNNKDDYKTLYYKTDAKIFANYTYLNKYWDQIAVMSKLGNMINDWYLKLSGEKEGTSSYSDSETEIDDSGKVIYLSRYQRLAVQLFANQFPSALD